MSATADPAVVEKIRKLLRMEHGGTDAERDTALAMAQRLAMKHGVDISEVDVQEVTTAGEPFETGEFKPTGYRGAFMARFPTSHKWITRLLQRYFAVDVITSYRRTEFTRHDGQKRYGRVDYMELHGRKSAVQIAMYVYGFLFHEFTRRWLAELKRRPELSMVDRNGFYGGLYYGLDEKLEAERGRTEKELQAELDNGAAANRTVALVIQGEDAKREASLKEQHPRLRYVTTDYGRVNDYSAHLEGKRQGREITINPALKS
jgi:hypothetical protein